MEKNQLLLKDEIPLMHTTSQTLKMLAALTWYIGCVVLAVKGWKLLVEADVLAPDRSMILPAVFLGLIFGTVKAIFLFSRNCRKNLARIDGLKQPRIWQFFRPRFFLFLALMITLGATLSRLAHGNYIFLICVAILDISLVTALLGSSIIFWKKR